MNNNPCGSIVSSACVPYTGKKLTFLAEEEQIACNASINDVFSKLNDRIKTLTENTDVSLHTFTCSTLSTPKTVKSVLQDHSTKLCALAASIDAVLEQVAEIDVANELVTIDLGDLAGSAAPCEVATNTYTLIAILNTFKNEIIAIKTHLGL